MRQANVVMLPDFQLSWKFDDDTDVTIRPIQPGDAVIEQEFVRALSTRSKIWRFFAPLKELSAVTLKRFTRSDFPHDLALIATISRDGVEREIGVARYAPTATDGHVEFAVVVADDWQGKGIATQLLRHLFNLADEGGIKSIEGLVMRENVGMLALAKELGFEAQVDVEDATLVYVYKDL
jgi:acetyltransferase